MGRGAKAATLEAAGRGRGLAAAVDCDRQRTCSANERPTETLAPRDHQESRRLGRPLFFVS
jgi:hypothetical protein